ncbi:MAG: DinB family protein [Chitinophagia bacterium]|nr:DinB family protein [Chitinophagia bacterium]
MQSSNPKLTYPPFAENYIREAAGTDPLAVFQFHQDALFQFIISIPAARSNYRYAPDKWTIQQVLQHINDTERVLSYRLLAICRGDVGPLPSFDENQYASASLQSKHEWDSTIEEWVSLRKSTQFLLKSIDHDNWEKVIQVGDYSISARALGLMITGHPLHHRTILQTRYGC